MSAAASLGRKGADDSRTTRSRPVARVLAGAAVLATLLFVGRQAAHLFPSFVGRVDALGAWGPVAFVLGYSAAVVALVPASILTLAAGAIFGLARGTAFTLPGAILGSSVAFLIARCVARSAVERRLAGDPRFAAIDRAIGDRGLLIVFLLRLSPVFPFSLLNYGLGLAGDVAAAAGGAQVGGGPGRWIVMGAGLVATVLVTAIVTGLARRSVEQRTGNPAERRLDGPAV